MPQNVKINDHKRCENWQACAELKENIFERTMKISLKETNEMGKISYGRWEKGGDEEIHKYTLTEKSTEENEFKRKKTMDDQKRANE